LDKNDKKPQEIDELTTKINTSDIIKQELERNKNDELNIVPKKPNWDLKSQVETRLEKLKRKTQKVIVEILREKLAAEARTDSDTDNE
jgi:coiled-coil domain-containing protein 12